MMTPYEIWQRQLEIVRSTNRFTMAEIAELTGLSLNSVRQYRSRGLLPPASGFDANRPFWTAEDIADWVAERPAIGRPRKVAS